MKDKGKLTIDDLQRVFVNPFYAITIDEGLFGEHEAMVSKEEWIKINSDLIEGRTLKDGREEKGIGTKKWLELLLEVLEGGYVVSQDVGKEK